MGSRYWGYSKRPKNWKTLLQDEPNDKPKQPENKPKQPENKPKQTGVPKVLRKEDPTGAADSPDSSFTNF